MRKRITAVFLAVCISVSLSSIVFAGDEVPPIFGPFSTSVTLPLPLPFGGGILNF